MDGIASLKRAFYIRELGLTDQEASMRSMNDLEHEFFSNPGAAETASDNRSLIAEYLSARGGSVGTSGVAAVALRFDHGLANFKNTILPLLTARQLPASLAINPSPDNMALAENAGVTWADVADWTMEKGIEVWNH